MKQSVLITGGSRVTEALLESAGALLDQAERYRASLKGGIC